MIYQQPLNLKEKIMDIRLNQIEIEKAIRQYVGQQGISLANKTLGIVFTSGRKENGLIADLTITESDIPGYDDQAILVPTRDYGNAYKDAGQASDAATGVDTTVLPAAEVVEATPVKIEDAAAVTDVADTAKPAATSLFAS